MTEDFDHIDDDFDIEGEFGDFAELEHFNEGEELDAISVRTAVLQKDNMVALLCIRTANTGAAICRVDPRESRPAVQVYDDAALALEWFTKSLRTSRKNGWNLVYDGLPLQG